MLRNRTRVKTRTSCEEWRPLILFAKCWRFSTVQNLFSLVLYAPARHPQASSRSFSSIRSFCGSSTVEHLFRGVSLQRCGNGNGGGSRVVPNDGNWKRFKNQRAVKHQLYYHPNRTELLSWYCTIWIWRLSQSHKFQSCPCLHPPLRFCAWHFPLVGSTRTVPSPPACHPALQLHKRALTLVLGWLGKLRWRGWDVRWAPDRSL